MMLLVGFIAYEATLAKQPLMTFSIFKSRSVSGGNAVAALVGAALLAMFFCLSLYEQQVLHYSALKTGLSYLPLTGMLTAFAFVAPALIPRIGIRAVIFSARSSRRPAWWCSPPPHRGVACSATSSCRH